MSRDCLTEERLALYLEDRMEPDERERAEEHLSRCGDCRRQLVQVHAHRREEEVALRAPESLKRRARAIPRRTSRPPLFAGAFRWQAALAAVLVAALGLAIYLTSGVVRPPGEVPDADRLRASSSGTAGLVALAPEADAVVAPRRIDFRWSEVDQAERYTLSVLDALGNIVFREEARGLEQTVDLEELPRDGTYYWYVTAKLGDGTSMDSKIRRFTLGPQG